MAIVFENEKQSISFLAYSFIGSLIAKEAPLGDVLDIACNIGMSTQTLKDKLPDAAIVGGDIDEKLIEKARRNYTECKFEVINALNLPPRMFDAVVSCHTIEHFNGADQRTFLRGARKILKEGGLFFCCTPDVDVLRAQGTAGSQPDHIKELTKKELVGLIENAGFRIEKMYGQGIFARSSLLRRVLNTVKKLDYFNTRRFARNLVNSVDRKTQPIEMNFDVRPLGEEETALNLIVIARKAAA
ncbi:MAG: class I SAM-dependent methyltransferase [Candidatus Liptonbacteria bacterium]|nr:class I SAM-dependent methyltransferase [Candidatus Liptonbacteria bacterium]